MNSEPNTKLAEALERFEEFIDRIEGEWGMGHSIETLRAKGDSDVQLLDDARAELAGFAAGRAENQLSRERLADLVNKATWKGAHATVYQWQSEAIADAILAARADKDDEVRS